MTDIKVKDIFSLDKAEKVESGDTLLLVRANADGTQSCMRIEGGTFSGKSAYDVAREQGYTGSYEEWAAQIDKASSTGVSFDGENGEIVITTA